MPGVDELEEEHGAVLADRQVADLVNHQEGGMGEHLEPSGQVAGGLGLGERVDEACERAVVDAPSGLGCGDRQVGLSDPGRAEQDDVLGALDEAELVQAVDLLAA